MHEAIYIYMYEGTDICILYLCASKKSHFDISAMFFCCCSLLKIRSLLTFSTVSFVTLNSILIRSGDDDWYTRGFFYIVFILLFFCCILYFHTRFTFGNKYYPMCVCLFVYMKRYKVGNTTEKKEQKYRNK